MVTSSDRHVVALGGGGFSMEPENRLLDDFILSLSRRQPARVCFLPTASGDSGTYVAKFYRAFADRCIASDLTLFSSPTLPRRPSRSEELAGFVREQDVFYVGGGNTVNLLALWRTHGLDVLLRRAWRAGAVMSGLSAGMVCWFEGGVTDSYGRLQGVDDGLGLIKGTACPHYDSEPGRRAVFKDLVARRKGLGYAADDGAALHFVGRRLHEVVSSRSESRAYRVRVHAGEVTESDLPVRFLGK